MEIDEALQCVYDASLRVYPAKFRSEFGAEMKHVFAEALERAREDGWAAVLRLIVHELKYMPGSWLREHRQAWRDEEEGMQTNGRRLLGDDHVTGGPTGSWREGILAALPYLMFGIFETLGSLLGEIGVISPENKGMQALNYAGLVCLAGTIFVTLIFAWRRGWPLWSASWYLIYTLPLLWLMIWLVNQTLDPFSALGQISSFLIVMLLIGGVLYAITRLDRSRGMLAALPLLYLLWLPNLEQTPNHIIPFHIRIGLVVASMVFVVLGLIAMVRIRDWRASFWIVLATILVVGLQYSYVGIYHGGTLPNIAPGPSPLEVLKSFLPQYLAAFSILIGPLFARMFRTTGGRGGIGGKVGYHLALLGLLAVIVSNLVGVSISIGDYFGDTRPVFIVLEWLIKIGLVGYAAGLSVLYGSARRSGNLPDPVEMILLAILPALMPLAILSPFIYATRPMTPLYGFPVLWELPQGLVLTAGLTWLLLSAWLVTRRPRTTLPPVAVPQPG